MRILESFPETRAFRRHLRAVGHTVGLVPTMGALHEGHLSLVKKSLWENDATLVTLFVNPTQFDRPEDLSSYPRDLERDQALLREAGVTALVVPSPETVYPEGYLYKVSALEDEDCLCGATRPGHFDGVLTVVLKLFGWVEPHRAYFGEKDFQQLRLIRGMARDFFLDLEVVGCPTVREADGLAMSSRNLLLSESERALAPRLHDVLQKDQSLELCRQQIESAGFRIDYLEDRWGRRFVAAFLGSVRLIDNVPRQPSADRASEAS